MEGFLALQKILGHCSAQRPVRHILHKVLINGTSSAKGRAAILQSLASSWTGDPGNAKAGSSWSPPTFWIHLAWSTGCEVHTSIIHRYSVDTQTQMECKDPSQGHAILFSWERLCQRVKQRPWARAWAQVIWELVNTKSQWKIRCSSLTSLEWKRSARHPDT